MGMRGKKSTADLAVVPPPPAGGITTFIRPMPMVGMTKEQSLEWNSVVNRMPADWFPRETHAMLAQYCRHVVNAKRIAQLIEKLASEKNPASDFLETYDQLLRMQDRESRALSSLATRMRMSQQAQYNHKKKTGSNITKPWD